MRKMVCDRCKREDILEAPKDSKSWFYIEPYQVIYAEGKHYDLCPFCIKEYAIRTKDIGDALDKLRRSKIKDFMEGKLW